MPASACLPGVCFLSIVVPPWLFAATITVDPSGGGDFTAIQPALDAAADGDTVLVKRGEYVITEPLRFNRLHDPSNSASPPLKDLVLRAEGGAERTVLRGVEGIDSVVFFYGESWRSVLDGFTVTGAAAGFTGSPATVAPPFCAASCGTIVAPALNLTTAWSSRPRSAATVVSASTAAAAGPCSLAARLRETRVGDLR